MEEVKPIVTKKELADIFNGNSDCYANTGRFENDGSYHEGEVIPAMTEEIFVNIVWAMLSPPESKSDNKHDNTSDKINDSN